MDRFSRKRQAILDCLRETKTHPTADWIYAQLKPVYPDISLATVYRNLHQLMDAGTIRSVGVFSGKERFDAIAANHPHIVCTRCGAVNDAGHIQIPQALIDTVQESTGYTVSEAAVQLTGLCQDCKRENG